MASKIRVLSDDDFIAINSNVGRLLGCTTPGYMLVLFYSNKSAACKPVFLNISGLFVPGCMIGVMSVHSESRAVRISKGTVTELTKVPTVMMYVDGHPKAIFHSAPSTDPTTNDYHNFVLKIMREFKSTGRAYVSRPAGSSGSAEEGGSGEQIKPIPEYSIGVPICSDGVCYLPINEAYATAN